MTNNTIHNVPRELLERHLKTIEGHLAITLEGELARSVYELRALLSAPPPAGVDGLELDRNEAYQACPDSGCDWGSFWQGWKARHTGAQAIIDGLRGEVGAQRVNTCIALKERNDAREERDQQAKRIGELEGLLRDCYPGCGLTARQTQSIRERIDAALSAGKEVE